MTSTIRLTAALLALPGIALAQSTYVEPTVELTLGLSTTSLYQREHFGFDGTGYAGAGVFGQYGPLQYRLQLGTDEDGALIPDGTFVQYATGNWVFGAGAIDRHWGTSRDTSLILSSNARPHPTVYIRKETPTAFNLPVLEWLGPWDFETFIGQLEDDRGVPNTKTFGMRVGINPFPGFVLNLERMAQWGGDGRPETAEAFFNLLIGNSNQDNAQDDPANQLAGISFSYTLPDTWAPARIYGQITGEDFNNGRPSELMHVVGLDYSAPIFGVPSVLTFEMVDTRIDSLSGNLRPNTAYENRFYPSGYTYLGRVMGAAIDTDSVSFRVSGQHDFAPLTVEWGLAEVSINEPGVGTHRLSSVPASGLVADLGGSYDFNGGLTVQAGVSYQGFDLNTADITEGLSASILLTRTF